MDWSRMPLPIFRKFRACSLSARNSSFAYKGRTVDVRQIARELGVRYVLEGSIRQAANRLRITAQLIEGEGRNPYLGRQIRGCGLRHFRPAGSAD